MTTAAVVCLLAALCAAAGAGSGTYDPDDAWRQMSSGTDHKAVFTAITGTANGSPCVCVKSTSVSIKLTLSRRT